MDIPYLGGEHGLGPPSPANRMLSLLICVAKDNVIIWVSPAITLTGRCASLVCTMLGRNLPPPGAGRGARQRARACRPSLFQLHALTAALTALRSSTTSNADAARTQHERSTDAPRTATMAYFRDECQPQDGEFAGQYPELTAQASLSEDRRN